jgi:hypothetical protein
MFLTPPPIVTRVNLEQEAKALVPILVTLLGMVTLVRLKFASYALSEILAVPLGIIKSVACATPRNNNTPVISPKSKLLNFIMLL